MNDRPLPLEDFPAAHSMDTDWFAVDETGRVACFRSSESGAVPNTAALGISPGDSTFDLVLLEAFLMGRLLADGRGPPLLTDVGALPDDERAVVVAGSLEAFADLVNAGVLDVVREQAPAVLVTRKEAGPERRRELAARAGFQGFIHPEDQSEELKKVKSEDGLLRFDHDDFSSDPDFYERGPLPTAPLRAEDLPPGLKEALGGLRLPIDFATTERLHLTDHLPAGELQTWGDVPPRGGPDVAPPPSKPTPAPQPGGLGARVWVPLLLGLALLVVAWLVMFLRH